MRSQGVPVITGLGVVSSLGSTLDDVADALRNGRSGIVADAERREAGFRSALTGLVCGFDPADRGITRKMRRTMCEPATFAYAAACDAIDDAALHVDQLKSERCGIVMGNDSCVKPAVESIDLVREHGSNHFIGSGYVFRAMNSTVSMNLANAFGTLGANWTTSAACASSAHALGQAAMLIRSGYQDIVLAGGAQETNAWSMASFDALDAFSTEEDDPASACRPFDAKRDGLVPSGGAACLIVEDLAHAKARNARIYAVLSGFGFSSDGAGHLFRPDAKGATRAMQMALNDAGVESSDIDYVNAHATSTPHGDIQEATAIYGVFGDRVAVSSTKSMTGHECWMAGASEAVYTCLMARHGFLAPNLNFKDYDQHTPHIDIIREPRRYQMQRAVSNSFGFGGTNATLVLDFSMQG